MRPIDADALIQTLVINGWLKMDPISDSTEMIAVQAAIDESITIACHTSSELDRSRWEGCGYCNDKDIESFSKATSIRYCQFCGRPLTEQAWAELGSRVGGENESIR